MPDEGLPKPNDQVVITMYDFYEILAFLVRETLELHDEGLPQDEIAQRITDVIARSCQRKN